MCDHEVDEEGHNQALEKADYENWIEVESLLALVREKKVEPNFFNSFEWANNYRERVSEPTTELLIAKLIEENKITLEFKTGDFDTSRNPVGLEQIDYLEQQWKKLGDRDRSTYPDKQTYRVDSPLETFLMDMSYGSYPTHENLAMISRCFELYLLADGELTLEEVFFGKPVKGSGNYAKRYTKALYYREFHYQVIREKVHCLYKKEKFSLDRFAENYIEIHKDDDVCAVNATNETIEAYIRGYRRWLDKIPESDK